MTMELRWCGGAPGSSSGPNLQLVRTPKQREIYVSIQGPIVGLWTHYVAGRSVPCLASGCPVCDKAPARWKGYAPALVYMLDPKTKEMTWQPSVFELTEKCAALVDLPDVIGAVYKFTRRGKRGNSAVLYTKLCSAGEKELPPMPKVDVKACIQRLFDLPGRHNQPE